MIVSTADSFLLVPATNMTRDVFQRYIYPEATERLIVLVSRTAILGLGFVAALATLVLIFHAANQLAALPARAPRGSHS